MPVDDSGVDDSKSPIWFNISPVLTRRWRRTGSGSHGYTGGPSLSNVMSMSCAGSARGLIQSGTGDAESKGCSFAN